MSIFNNIININKIRKTKQKVKHLKKCIKINNPAPKNYFK